MSRDFLTREYAGLIDLGDTLQRSAFESELVFASRALAAMSLQLLTGCSPDEAAASVTDGRDDQGIDAIGYSSSAPGLWLVQAKWSGKGTASFGVLHGLRQLDNRDFDRFNNRVQRHAARVRDILESPECRVHLVVAVMGEQATKEQARRLIEQAAADFGSEVECHVLALPDFHAAAHRSSLPRSIELVATLIGSWFARDFPQRTVYGLLDAGEVALWYEEHGVRLFDRNIRNPLGMTPPNLGIVETLRTAPENFSYFNNGITVLCDAIETEFFSRPVEGAPVRLRLTGATVVNGAQTIASVYYAHQKHPENVVRAGVPVRFISLANAPEGFARSVGVATNTQHHTGSRDFVALDEVQGSIRDDFRTSLDKEYVFRRGELIPTPTAGCSMEEAAVALACGPPRRPLSALANASTERLWEATSEGPYTRLFGRQPSALQIWRSVLLLRAVREALHELRPRLNGRSAAIAERGTLPVTHLVFRLRGAEGIDDPDADWEQLLDEVPGLVRPVLAALIPLVDDLFGSNSFVATTFGRPGGAANSQRRPCTPSPTWSGPHSLWSRPRRSHGGGPDPPGFSLTTGGSLMERRCCTSRGEWKKRPSATGSTRTLSATSRPATTMPGSRCVGQRTAPVLDQRTDPASLAACRLARGMERCPGSSLLGGPRRRQSLRPKACCRRLRGGYFSCMGGVLRAEALWVETFTGLRMRQFDRLLKVVRERGGNGPGGGRPWCLPLADRVLLVAVYYRTNLTMRQLAPLFGCSPATVCRVIQRLRPLLAIEPATRPADAVERLWIVDGTLIPVRDRKVGASSRNYRFSSNVQVIIDADTKLVIAAARPVPGNTADAKAWRDSGLADICHGVTVLGDGAYTNTGLVIPHRKRPGRPLLPGQETDNAAHRKVRARVEHAFARMKHYKILRDCRQRGNGLHYAVQAVATLHNHALAV